MKIPTAFFAQLSLSSDSSKNNVFDRLFLLTYYIKLLSLINKKGAIMSDNKILVEYIVRPIIEKHGILIF